MNDEKRPLQERTGWRIVFFVAITLVAARVGANLLQSALAARQAPVCDCDLQQMLADNVPQTPAAPEEIGSIAPYHVESPLNLHEVGGIRRASQSWTVPESHASVGVSIHTCRPVASPHGPGTGELNVVNGEPRDLCTSGGTVTVGDGPSDADFEIHFKLVGTPNGFVLWNARQLALDDHLFRQLSQLRRTLRTAAPISSLPASMRSEGDEIAAYSHDAPQVRLMHGSRREMLRLLAFRDAFREFYEHQDQPQAQRIAWLIIDALLSSPEQQKLTARWRHFEGASSATEPNTSLIRSGMARPIGPGPSGASSQVALRTMDRPRERRDGDVSTCRSSAQICG